MKQLRVNKITEYLEAKKNFEKDYIGIEEQDIDENGHKSVIDGVERLTTIHEFVQNKSWMDN